MRYLSPSSLPDNPSLDPPDKKALILQRRKLLAELELSTDGTIKIKDRTFSKNDILEYFDELQDDTLLGYYAEVAKDQTLVDFLETGQLADDAAFADSPLYAEPAFLEWISPFFYTAFIEYISICLSEGADDQLFILMHLPPMLTDYDRERAWIHIGQILEANVSQLRQLYEQAEKGHPVPTEGIVPLVGDALIRMIVMLPEAPFAGVRNRYAAFLMQLSIHVFNKQKGKRDITKAWMVKVKRLAVSKDLVTEAEEKIREMHKIRNKSGTGMTRAIVVICIILVKIFAFSNHSGDRVTTIPRLDNNTVKDTMLVRIMRQYDSINQLKKNRSYPLEAPDPRKDSTPH